MSHIIIFGNFLVHLASNFLRLALAGENDSNAGGSMFIVYDVARRQWFRIRVMQDFLHSVIAIS